MLSVSAPIPIWQSAQNCIPLLFSAPVLPFNEPSGLIAVYHRLAFGQFPEVLGGCCEGKFVSDAAWPEADDTEADESGSGTNSDWCKAGQRPGPGRG